MRSVQPAIWRYLIPFTAAVILAAGCGSGVGAASRPTPAPPPLLPTAMLPGMAAKDSVLTPAVLAQDAPIAGLADRIAGFGYESGAQRVFAGRTSVFSNVVSRALRFSTAAGARAYVEFVKSNVAGFFGRGSTWRRIRSAGRSGYLIEVASCGCHRETPIYVAVISRGAVVTWLYGTGPGVRIRTLRTLLAKAP